MDDRGERARAQRPQSQPPMTIKSTLTEAPRKGDKTMSYALQNASGLISQYPAVDLFRLRQARNSTSQKPEHVKVKADTLTYHVRYVTMCNANNLHADLKEPWNHVIDGKGHFVQSKRWQALKQWCKDKSAELGDDALLVAAYLVRNDNSEVVVQIKLI